MTRSISRFLLCLIFFLRTGWTAEDPDVMETRIEHCIRDLNSPAFETREAAKRALIEWGTVAQNAVEETARNGTPEARELAREILYRIGLGQRIAQVSEELKRAFPEMPAKLLETEDAWLEYFLQARGKTVDIPKRDLSLLGPIALRAAVKRSLSDDLQKALGIVSGWELRELIPDVVRLLDHPEAEVRLKAIMELGLIRKHGADARMLKILDSGDSGTQAEVIRALGTTGSPEFETELSRRLNELKGMALGYAVETLGRVHCKESIADIRRFLVHQDFMVRGAATYALGQLKDRESIPALAERLQDSSKYVRGQAAMALAVLGAREYIPDIRKMFIAQDDSFEYACRALGELKVKEAVPEIKNLREQTNDAIHLIFLDTALSMLDDPDANTRILNVLKKGESPTEVFRTACRAATQLRLKEAVPLLKPYLRSECYYTRLITLRGVLRLEYNEP